MLSRRKRNCWLVEFLPAASGDELGIERDIRYRQSQPAFHAVEGDVHLAHGGVTECVVRLREGSFFHDHVPVTQASAHILAAQLDDDQSRGAIENSLIRVAAVLGSLCPIVFDGMRNLFRLGGVTIPMCHHHDRARAVRKSRQPVAPPRQPLQPAGSPRARRQIGLDSVFQRRLIEGHNSILTGIAQLLVRCS